jgi:hypothetical protein
MTTLNVIAEQKNDNTLLLTYSSLNKREDYYGLPLL